MDAISPAALLAFVMTLGLAILSPGPAIIACTRSAAARGREAALPYSVGLAVGASLWCLFSLFGLSLLFLLWGWFLDWLTGPRVAPGTLQPPPVEPNDRTGVLIVDFKSPDRTLNNVPGTIVAVDLPTKASAAIGSQSPVRL